MGFLRQVRQQRARFRQLFPTPLTRGEQSLGNAARQLARFSATLFGSGQQPADFHPRPQIDHILQHDRGRTALHRQAC